MSKPDKAQIKFGLGNDETTLRFHSVISEEHEISTDISKYPSQSGKTISNNAVRKNKKISIEGLITNNQIFNAENFVNYGSKATGLLFTVLERLVRDAVPCEVQTNLGVYTPVIFTGFRTKQKEGMTDAMQFVIRGEEVQLATLKNRPAPKPLPFKVLTDAERDAEIVKLGLVVSKTTEVSKASIVMGESFSVQVSDVNGDLRTTTYNFQGYDPVSQSYQYEIHTTDTDVFDEETLQFASEVADVGLPESGLAAGVNVFSACIVESAVGLAEDLTNDLVATAFGDLTKSIYGAYYGLVGVLGDKAEGQILLSLALDCLIAGAVGGATGAVTADQFDTTIPTKDDILAGAKRHGDNFIDGTASVVAPTTLTKISEKNTTTSTIGGFL